MKESFQPHRKAYADRTQHTVIVPLVLFLVLFTTKSFADQDLRRFSAPPGKDSWSVRVIEDMPLPSNDLADVYAPRIPRGLLRSGLLEDRFPLVALLQGAQVDKSQYSEVARLIAAEGFIVFVPNHFNPIFAGLFTEISVITDVFDAAIDADADATSPLYNIIDTDSMGTIGHSFGGFIGLYAIADTCVPFPSFDLCSDGTPDALTSDVLNALKAGAFYGTHLVGNDGTATDLDTSGGAVSLIRGTEDGVATKDEISKTYPVLEIPLAVFEVEGANHFGICNEDDPPGAAPDPNDPTIDQAEANREVARWITLWLEEYLK